MMADMSILASDGANGSSGESKNPTPGGFRTFWRTCVSLLSLLVCLVILGLFTGIGSEFEQSAVKAVEVVLSYLEDPVASVWTAISNSGFSEPVLVWFGDGWPSDAVDWFSESSLGVLLWPLFWIADGIKKVPGTAVDALPVVLLTMLVAAGKLSLAKRLDEFVETLNEAKDSTADYLQCYHGWTKCMQSWLKPGLYLGVVLAFTGWYGLGSATAPEEITYLVSQSAGYDGPNPPEVRVQRVRIPVPLNLHVGFDSAGLDVNDRPTGPGAKLEPLRQKALEPTVQMLKNCAIGTGESIEVNILGFASNEPFRSFSFDDAKNDNLNRDTANQRASSVYEALQAMLEDHPRVQIHKPTPWKTHEEMRMSRDETVTADQHDHYAHRVVVLQVPQLPDCVLGDLEPSQGND